MTRKTQLRLTLAASSLLLTLGVLELAGRLTVPAPAERTDGFVNDSQLGWALPKSSTMQWRGKAVRINRLGLRGPEPASSEKLALIVGDSSVFGDGVDDHQTMAAQLERALDGRMKVQNGGVPGYTCWQSRLWVERLRSDLNPDVLVIYNQHSDYRRASSHDRVIAATQLGPLASIGIGWLISDLSLRRRMEAGASNLSVDEYRKCLLDLADDQRAAGGTVVFVQPICDVDFPSSPLHGQTEPGEPGTRLVDYRAVMRDVAQELNAPLVVGADVVQAAGLTGDAALIDTVHPTADGHTALAEGIAAAVIKSTQVGLVPQSN